MCCVVLCVVCCVQVCVGGDSRSPCVVLCCALWVVLCVVGCVVCCVVCCVQVCVGVTHVAHVGGVQLGAGAVGQALQARVPLPQVGVRVGRRPWREGGRGRGRAGG